MVIFLCIFCLDFIVISLYNLYIFCLDTTLKMYRLYRKMTVNSQYSI